MQKGIVTTAGLGLGAVLFLAGNLVSDKVLAGVRADVTEDGLFTLSAGARNIAANLEEPVQLYLYFSEQAVAEDNPQLLDYGRRVEDLLGEFVRASDDKITLEVVDPEPFSEQEDQAMREGLRPISLQNGDPYFLGIVGADTLDNREVLPFVDVSNPTAERYLEYDLARMLHQLSTTERPTLGLLTTLPMEGSPGNQMMGQQGQPRWQVLTELGRFFDLRTIAPDATEIDADVDTLLVVHPRELSDETKYALDQYVVAGRPAMFFVDPHCNQDQSNADPNNPMAGMFGDKSSSLNDLFTAWGFEVVPNKVVGDRQYAARVNNTSRQSGALEAIDHPAILDLDGEDVVAEQDAAVSALQRLIVPYSGAIQAVQAATTELEPLVQTSEDSTLFDVGLVQGPPQPEELLRNFVSEKRRMNIAARVTGPAKSAFPGGLSDGEELPEDAVGPVLDEGPGHLEEGDIHVVVVADADLLADRNWGQEQRLGQLSLGYRKFADNADLATNTLEGLAGGEDLARLQVRNRYDRPFQTFEDMQQEAEQRYLDEQLALEQELQGLQERINELQREKSADQALILSPEQEAALEEARAKQIETRERLRAVRRSLRTDIERLQTQLKTLNMAGMPALVLLVGIGVALTRTRRRG